jgi:hypothetical protein
VHIERRHQARVGWESGGECSSSMTGVAGILSTQASSRPTTGVGKGVLSAEIGRGNGCSTGVLSA